MKRWLKTCLAECVVALGLLASGVGTDPVQAGDDAATEPVSAPTFASLRHDWTYYLEFQAREDGAFGHAYMVIEAVDQRGAVHRASVFGFGTAAGAPSGLWSIFGTAGEIGTTRDDFSPRLTERFRVPIRHATYRRLKQSVAAMHETWTIYELLFLNCNSFVGVVAQEVGLKAPVHDFALPADYVHELKLINTAAKTN